MSNNPFQRDLILLRYIVDHEDSLNIRKACCDIGYRPTTVQKYINALHDQEFVVHDKQNKCYLLGPESIKFWLAALARLEIVKIAPPFILIRIEKEIRLHLEEAQIYNDLHEIYMQSDAGLQRVSHPLTTFNNQHTMKNPTAKKRNKGYPIKRKSHCNSYALLFHNGDKNAN
jgi:hypothetical protein